MEMIEKNDLKMTVIDNDYCIGCGACSFVNPAYNLKMDDFGMYKAERLAEYTDQKDKALNVCPFSNHSKNEDELAEELFEEVPRKNKFLGKYRQNYVGHVKEGLFREKGSSGGFGKWILHQLLEKDEVDYVIQVVNKKEVGNLFSFEVYRKGDDILSGSKSAYYPVTLKGALDFMKKNEGRYAITAIPCFSKAIRNLCKADAEIQERVKYIVGIICGHLKSTGFAESFAWQLEVEPQRLSGIEFRGKIPGLKANEKGVFAYDTNGQKSATKSSKQLLGGNWGHGFFKYKACDYCDDVVGETADVSVGDAWIKDLMNDHEGNNVVIVRNKRIAEIVKEAINDKKLLLHEVPEDVVVQSQWGGIKHRREGLSYRLYKRKKAGEWAPKKRVTASNAIPARRKKIYMEREQWRDLSHINFKKAKELHNFDFFEKAMKPHIEKRKLSLRQRALIKFHDYFLRFRGERNDWQ